MIMDRKELKYVRRAMGPNTPAGGGALRTKGGSERIQEEFFDRQQGLAQATGGCSTQKSLTGYCHSRVDRSMVGS